MHGVGIAPRSRCRQRQHNRGPAFLDDVGIDRVERDDELKLRPVFAT
jgi:hypothetical protein